jgi:hypothetical protein
MALADEQPGLQVRQFRPGYESFGVVVDYLAKCSPFDRLPAGELVTAVKHQVGHGHHVCAFRGERLVGYCGWLYTTVAIGEGWLAGRNELKSVDEGEAAALTLVRAEAPEVLRPMIRAVRRIGKGRRIFFRRDYEGRGQKRRTVLNV